MMKGLNIYIGLTVAALAVLAGLAWPAERAPQLPAPGVIDQIVHDRGNIVTTVQNFGYIGGYSWAGRPSGRWPANTTHDYLAEMRFWIGGINDAGDTLLDNTADDFNPIPSWIAGSLTPDIRLSTDPERYDYDASDTVGAGIGYPANGWRVWDPVNEQWVYNQVYSFIDSTFHEGGPLGVQESVCRFADDALGYPVMGLEITQTVRQWNYKYNKDMIFFTLQIRNASTENYHDVAIGLYCDFDVGGPDPATGENGRLGDLVAFDPSLDLAWTYDEDGYDPGWGPNVVTGVMGTVILSTPGDIGMTSFNTGQWEFLPQTDKGRFAMINNTEFDQSLPPTDQYYVQAVRGIDLPAGQTIQFDFALVAAPNAEYLYTTAERAKALYDMHFIMPRPPDPPHVRATAGDGTVKLVWDAVSEASVEPTTGQTDFRGYRIYRSSDRGVTWGTKITNPDYSEGPGYYPLATFNKDLVFNRIPHSYVDSNVTNGMQYWYMVAAFDSGQQNIDTLQNEPGTPENSTYVVRVVPRDNPLGYVDPQENMKQLYTGIWKPSRRDAVNIVVVDSAAITGDDYAVTFAENCSDLLWYLINTTTGDTVLADQDKLDGLYYDYPLADGFHAVVHKPERVPNDIRQSQYAIPNRRTLVPLFVQQFSDAVGCNDIYRYDAEIRFTATGSVAYDFFTGNPINVPFEVWNVTTDSQQACWIADWNSDGEWTPTDIDYVLLVNFDYDNGAMHPEAYPDYFTWMMAFDPDSSQPAAGNVLYIEGSGIPSPEDEYVFSSYELSKSLATQDLKKIHVVPNPYLGRAKWETHPGERKIQFADVPNVCTIRIYTLAGELIRTINHDDGSGTQDWDMLSEAGRGIASGVYLFNVESQYGNFTGKFAVIK